MNMDPAFTQTDHSRHESLFHIALRQRWVIVLSVIFFIAAGVAYLLKATPVYTSTSRLYVEQNGPKIMSDFEGVMTQSKNYLYTQAELMKSMPIVSDVVSDPEIRSLKTFTQRPESMFSGVSGFIKKLRKEIDVHEKEDARDIVGNLAVSLKKKIDVSVGKKDDLLTVSIDSPYSVEAARLVNAIIDSYIKYHSTRKRSTASEVLHILQKEKIQRDKELSGNFEKLLEFTRKNGMVSLEKSDSNMVFKRLDRLSTALTDAQLETITAKSDYEAALSMADEPDKLKQFAATQPNTGLRVYVTDVEMQLRTELREMEVEYKNVRYHCTEEHPSTQAILGKIEKIKGLLVEESQKHAEAYIEVMKLKWETAKKRESDLQESQDAQQIAAKDLNEKAVEYYMLESNMKRTERLCEILDDRIKELNVTEDTGALNISVLEVARPADKPSSPDKARIMAMVMVLGLMCGGGLALLRDQMDSRLRSADEISDILGVPVLGTVAAMAKKLSVSERAQKAHNKPKSVIAESYRTIRTALFFGAPKDKAKTILVTSAAPADGKSSMTSNLAITMAQAGQKTLIIDGDFRKPMQHNIFEMSNEKGLSSVLAGITTLDESIQQAPTEGLGILTCGPEVPNPSEILNGEAFGELLKKLCEQYDRIIIDSPPVGPVTDSRILAAICDVTILVLRAEKSTRKLSMQTRDALRSVNANLIGVVVNAVSKKQGQYGYYTSYGYNATYGYYGSKDKA